MSSVAEVVDLGDAGGQLQRGQRPRRPGQLQPGLLQVVGVQVRVAQGVHELAGPQADHLGHHLGQQGVGRDVERHARGTRRRTAGRAGRRADRRRRRTGTWCGTAEVPSPRPRRRSRPRRCAGGSPGSSAATRTTAAIWSMCRPSGRRPGPPLMPVDRAEFALGVGPLVPDADPALLQPAHVRRPLQEPQQLDHHRPDVHLLGGDQRETRRPDRSASGGRRRCGCRCRCGRS